MCAKVGKAAPAWKAQALVDGEIKQLSSDEYKGKYHVIFFWPADFTFVCPTEICAFSDAVEQFRKVKCEVIGVSVDNVFSHLAWSNTPRNRGGIGSCSFPMVSDLTKSMARDFGVLIEDGEDAGVALRGAFIVSDKGILRQATINDLPVGRSVEEMLRLVQGFQFTDEHGEVCPAGWKPGSTTMKADPKQSMDYFSKLEGK